MTRYPHTLNISIVDESTRDALGNYLQGDSTSLLSYPCREHSQQPKTFNGSDGKTYVYRSVIYCPWNIPTLPLGIKVQILDSEGIRTEGVIVLFIRNRKDCQLWV